MAIDFSDLGAQPVNQAPIDFSDLGATPASVPPQDMRRWDQKASDVISPVLSAVGNFGKPNVPYNEMTNQGNKPFEEAGTATTEFLGKLGVPGTVAAIPGTAISMANPENWVSPRTPVPEGGIGLPGTDMAGDMAGNMARRSLGVTKGMIKKMPGGIETANAKAQTLMNESNIPGVLSGATGNLESAENALNQSGTVIGTILKRAGQNAFDTNDVSSQIIDELAPNYPAQGAYGNKDALANEIVDTVMAHGNGPISFQSAQDLKNTLQEEAGANWQSAPLRAAAYQKAYGIVGDAMENGIQEASDSGTIPDSLMPLYTQHKNIYGAAKMAVTGLRDKAAGEAANNILSLPSMVAGAGAMASGHIGAGLDAIGLWELAKRYGAGTAARIANVASKATIPTRLGYPASGLAQVSTDNGE